MCKSAGMQVFVYIWLLGEPQLAAVAIHGLLETSPRGSSASEAPSGSNWEFPILGGVPLVFEVYSMPLGPQNFGSS